MKQETALLTRRQILASVTAVAILATVQTATEAESQASDEYVPENDYPYFDYVPSIESSQLG